MKRHDANPDLVIRGGTIVDGSGGDLFEADVAIKDGRITEVGKVAGCGKDEIDARGKLVTPGFVDIHTHYDGQVTWSQDITPSSQHGVTTAVMGNCGVGFAPCRPADHVRLIQLMEGVEDIPEPVLSAGIPWDWESFPDYIDWLAKRRFDIDIGAQLPHAALRVYVMGERGARRDPSTADDNNAMAALAGDAVRRRRARLLDLAHPQPPHLDRRLHADLEGRRGRTDGDRRRHAWRRPQRAAIRARPEHRRRRSADAAAGRGNHPLPAVVFRRAGRQDAAALAPDHGYDQRGRRPRAVDHDPDRRAPGGAAARARVVAQPVPDPSELPGHRAAAARGAAGAAAPARGARRDPAARRRPRPTIRCSSGRTTTRCICSAIPRTTNSRPRMRSARGRAARGERRKSSPMRRC